MSHHIGRSLNRIAFNATTHCLTGCAIGEVLGMVAGTAFGWSNPATIVLSIALAFLIGYSFTVVPLLRTGMALRIVLPLAFAADTLSITTMELVDNAVIVFIPYALNAGLTDFLFWGSLAISLVLAGIAAFPVNRWLIAGHKGHAIIHEALPHHH